MPKFSDPTGREWSIPPLTDAAIRRLAAETGVDFYALADDGAKFTETLFIYTHRLLPVLVALCDPEKAGVPADVFLGRFDGDTLEAAAAALWGAFADFFRGHPISQRVRREGVPAVRAAMAAAIAASQTPAAAGNG